MPILGVEEGEVAVETRQENGNVYLLGKENERSIFIMPIRKVELVFHAITVISNDVDLIPSIGIVMETQVERVEVTSGAGFTKNGGKKGSVTVYPLVELMTKTDVVSENETEINDVGDFLFCDYYVAEGDSSTNL